MNLVVKNTTKWRLIDLVVPHSCRGCGRPGELLCECCKKYNNLGGRFAICPICGRELAENAQKCPDCESPFERFYAVGWKDELLHTMVKDLKYGGVRAMAETLAGLMDDSIANSIFTFSVNQVALSSSKDSDPRQPGSNDSQKSKNTVTYTIVPLPTIGKHVRERGVDHTLMIAKKLAKRRGWKVERLLGRAVDTVQVGVKMVERQKQAKKAYEVIGKVNPEERYLLLDDVWTTGASMMAAAKKLQEAGAKHIAGAVIEVGRKPEIDKEEAE